MTALAIEWIWWIVGTFGVIGLIVAWVLAPAVMAEIFKGLLGILRLAVRTRIGCVIIAGIIIALIVNDRRHAYDDAEYAKRVAAFEELQKERDAKIAADTREQVQTEMADEAAAKAATDQEVKEFHDKLPPIPQATSNPFVVGPAAAQLRRIYGQPASQPASPQRVPKVRGPGKGQAHR